MTQGDGAPQRSDPVAIARHIAELVAARSSEAGSPRPLVALDHDGTLSPIAARPELARLAPDAASTLRALCEVADVVIISGRGLDDLAARFADIPVELVSEHGLRHRDLKGRTEDLAQGLDRATLAALRGSLAELLDDGPTGDGWLVEDKGVSIAVHHRAVPDDRLEPTLSTIRALLTAASEGGGHVLDGKAVVELRPAGADKGAALRTLHAARPGAVVVMVGDDVTDEPALAFAESSGGVGVHVAEEPSATAATARLRDPQAVVLMLADLARVLRPAR